jgi:YfiH family protein
VTIFQNGFVSYVSSNILDDFGIKHGFFMRHGGCSPDPWGSLNLATSVGDSTENVLENRKRIFNSLNLSPNAVFDVWQVHSSDVIIPEKKRTIGEPHLKADAIVTNRKDFSLLMLFADCIPILFYDPRKSVIGIAHAGWKGTVNKIVLHVVEQMKVHFGSKTMDINSIIGPCISVEKYQIGDDVANLARDAFKNQKNIVINQNGKFYLNLQRANQLLLESTGIRNIENIDICTASNKEDWFSHRQEDGKTGRFGAVISLSD